MYRTYIELKNLCTVKEMVDKMKRQHTEWKKYLQIIYLIKGWHLKYIKNSYTSIAKIYSNNNDNPVKHGQRNWIGSFPKKIHKWPTGTWKVAQYHLSSGKCTLKPQWNTTLCLLEWLLSKRQEITNAGEDVEKRQPLYTVGENVNWCSHYG